MGLDPYLDYDKINGEMVNDLRNALAESSLAKRKFSVEPGTRTAARLIRSMQIMDDVVESVCRAIYTEPMIVHIAGPRKTEQSPEDSNQEGVIQRCARCGSILHFWYEGLRAITSDRMIRELDEEEIPWWEPGQVVAKNPDSNGVVSMYEVCDRNLEKHEIECATIPLLSEN